MKLEKTVIIIVSVLVFTCSFTSAQQRDHFVFSQLKYRGGNWNMYPSSFAEIMNLLMTTTSVKPQLRRNDISLTHRNLFISPFMWMVGDRKFDRFTDKEIKILRQYLLCGGLLIMDDAIGHRNHGFDRCARELIKQLFPGKKLEKLPGDHAIYRAYYLLREVGGRKIVNRHLEGLTVGRRTAVVYSQNNLLGAWARDRMGNWLYECIPGGETQRLEAMKLTMNLIMYSLTGTYKKDMVHQPYIDKKLKFKIRK